MLAASDAAGFRSGGMSVSDLSPASARRGERGGRGGARAGGMGRGGVATHAAGYRRSQNVSRVEEDDADDNDNDDIGGNDASATANIRNAGADFFSSTRSPVAAVANRSGQRHHNHHHPGLMGSGSSPVVGAASSSAVGSSGGGPSWHVSEHLRGEVARLKGHLQGQIDALNLKITESRLDEQRARYRDRELIMQALQKQKTDSVAAMAAVSKTAAKALDTANSAQQATPKVVEQEQALVRKIQVRLPPLLIFAFSKQLGVVHDSAPAYVSSSCVTYMRVCVFCVCVCVCVCPCCV